jgi:hypothetical protein
MKNSFILYQDQEEVFTSLPKDKAGELTLGIFEYVRTGKISNLDPLVKIAFIPIKQRLDADKLKYDAKCLKNKEIATNRWKEENANAYERIRTSTKSTDIYHISYINNNLLINILNKYILVKEKNKKEKKRYGEYKWIVLTNSQYEKLCKDFTKDFIDNQIMLLDEYVQSNNNKYKYKDWNLVLRKSIREKWFVKDKPTQTKEPTWVDKKIEIKQASADEELKMKALLEEFK